MNKTTLNQWPYFALGLATIGTSALLGAWLWRRWDIPITETEMKVADVPSTPHTITPRVARGASKIQYIKDGKGPLFHRRYYVDIANPRLSKEELICRIIENLNEFSPVEMARFEKTKGPEETMKVGDEYYVHINGPWDGPVRVLDVQPYSFSFITLEGHLEAGEIQFRLLDHPTRRDAIRFEIRSWTRSADEVVNFAYDKARVVKYSQKQMWVFFCSKVAEASGGRQFGRIHVSTQKTEYEEQPRHHAPIWKQYTTQLEGYRKAKLNFDIEQRTQYTDVNGWRIDSYCTDLPNEPKGEPIKGGPWELAKEVLINYEFPDPTIVTGIYVPDDPLEKRVMLIRARFLFLSFSFGVKIGQVVDETRETEQGPARVWGYSYQTLEGHYEKGEMTFTVWKYLDSGTVEFRINAFSRVAYIPNPIYRLGFYLFGRRVQVRFANRALERMQQLVIARLTRSERAITAIDTPEVVPVSV